MIYWKEVNDIDTFRQEYTPLDDEQKEKRAAIKDKAQEILDLFASRYTVGERRLRDGYRDTRVSK